MTAQCAQSTLKRFGQAEGCRVQLLYSIRPGKDVFQKSSGRAPLSSELR